VTGRVTVVVVAYNDGENLERCVRSLRSALNAPILVIDNHSTDNTWMVATTVASELHRVTALRTEANGGYASAANIARREVDTEYLAVMNADCESTGDWVTPIVTHLDGHADVAAASPTVGLAGRSTLNAEGLDIHKAGFGFNRHLGRPLGEAADSPTRVPGIQGTAFVVRAAALDAIGGWYSGGFLYHEDVELSWSLRLAGHEVSHVPTPPVMHHYELTMSPEKFFLLERNRLEMLSTDLGAATKEVAVWLYALKKGSALVSAKFRSYRSYRERRSIRKARRNEVRSFRRISDRELLGAMQWRYPRSQTAELRRSATSSGRRGNRDMPMS